MVQQQDHTYQWRGVLAWGDVGLGRGQGVHKPCFCHCHTLFIGPVPKQQALDLSLGREFGSEYTNDAMGPDSRESYICSLVHFRDSVEPNGSNLKWSLDIYSIISPKCNGIVSVAANQARERVKPTSDWSSSRLK